MENQARLLRLLFDYLILLDYLEFQKLLGILLLRYLVLCPTQKLKYFLIKSLLYFLFI